MKKLFAIVLLMVATLSNGQVAMRTDKKPILDEFKKTETVFLLSNIYDTSVYENILKDSWKITPYKIVKIQDFNPAQYMDGKYSFAMIEGNEVVTKYARYLHTYMTIFMFDVEDKLKEIEKYKKLSEKKKKDYDFMEKHRIAIAAFLLFKNAEFIRNNASQAISAGTSNDFSNANFRHVRYLGNDMYEKDVFQNYKPGLLKNYFQKINSLIEAGTAVGYFGCACTEEIKNLKKATLYVPEYIGMGFNAFSGTENEKSDKKKNDLFEDYKYKYEYINIDELSNKILAGEDIYYLRYVMENGQKYLNVVNAKNGEVIYRNYHPMSYNLNKDNMEEIKKAIEKGKV